MAKFRSHLEGNSLHAFGAQATYKSVGQNGNGQPEKIPPAPLRFLFSTYPVYLSLISSKTVCRESA